MAIIHFILQGKGGVGKSMVAIMLYQALQELGCEVIGYDTDPVNSTLASFKEFDFNRLQILNTGDGNINTRKFDELLEALAETPENAHVIVDNGASSFLALASYMRENDMLDILAELGHTFFFHTIITGGQAVTDTVDGFIKLAKNFSTARIVVWLNPFFGEIKINDKSFIELKGYLENKNRVHSIISLPITNMNLRTDLEELFAKRQSFKVGMLHHGNLIGVRSRLRKYWETMVSFINEANLR